MTSTKRPPRFFSDEMLQAAHEGKTKGEILLERIAETQRDILAKRVPPDKDGMSTYSAVDYNDTLMAVLGTLVIEQGMRIGVLEQRLEAIDKARSNDV